MNPLNAILVAADFSAAANNAVRRPALLAREHGARLCVLHVIESGGAQRPGHRLVVPADQTPRAALVGESSRFGLIVLGQGAGRSIMNLLLGTRAGRLLDASACPVLVVKQAQGVDVVAVGRQPCSRWLNALLGSVSRRVPASVRRDVLVVPSGPGLPLAARASAARPGPSLLTAHR